MKIYDISLTLSPQSIRWVTAQPLELIERKRMSRGDTNNSSSIHTSVHAGTHVDAPFHFVPDGITIESLPLETFIGPARVCAVTPGTHITAADVAKAGLQGETRVLFKTRNSHFVKSRCLRREFRAIFRRRRESARRSRRETSRARLSIGGRRPTSKFLSIARFSIMA